MKLLPLPHRTIPMKQANHPTVWLSGAIADLPTPFDDGDGIDFSALAYLCERQIDAGATAIVVAETAGEASTLTLAEHDAIVRCAVKTARRRVRVIAGAGSNATHHAIELARLSQAAGADAVLSVVPYYNKPMQAGIAAHFGAIAAATDLPIVLHDIPSRTVRALADETLVKLAQSPKFIGLRDGSGDATRPLRLKAVLPADFRLLASDDATALAFLLHGGDGSIGVAAALFPNLCRDLADSCRHGRLRTALDIAERLAPLHDVLAGDIPAALKYALGRLGAGSPRLRLPLVELQAAERQQVAAAMAAIGAGAGIDGGRWSATA
jgi:4-hydroxy-tetrahydrodipicolinate synthase